MTTAKSEYGKGFIYNLILFSKHWWRHFDDLKMVEEMKKTSSNPDLWTDESQLQMWFNGAGDHFFDLKIPNQFKKTEIGLLAQSLQDRALHFRMNNCTREEFNKFFEDLESLARKIDRKLGIKPSKAQWN